MIQNQLAVRYGRALFQLAREKDKLEVCRDNLGEISRLMAENRELKQVLFHQNILPEKKKRVIKELFSEMDRIIVNFLCLLVDKRRIYFVDNIIREYEKLLNKDDNILQVKVTAAIDLDDELQESLREKLNSLLDHKIILDVSCDSSLIGGLKLNINNYVIDGSLKNKLKSLGERLNKIPVSELGVEL